MVAGILWVEIETTSHWTRLFRERHLLPVHVSVEGCEVCRNRQIHVMIEGFWGSPSFRFFLNIAFENCNAKPLPLEPLNILIKQCVSQLGMHRLETNEHLPFPSKCFLYLSHFPCAAPQSQGNAFKPLKENPGMKEGNCDIIQFHHCDIIQFH